MNIKSKFLELTSRTYPHGTEKDVYHLLSDRLTKDEYGNLWIRIGGSDVMFTCHLDTATSSMTNIKHVIDGNIIRTDGLSILGADDKAGATIMLYMIEKEIPGLYYFFVGEEVGCVGSRKVADIHEKEKEKAITKVVSFDRRGIKSVITHQCSKRCTSDEFAKALAKELNDADETFKYDTDDSGILTDSIQFAKIYPECTNISVGYQSEHTHSESQDINHLEKLAIACTKVNWAGLPVSRDPSKVEYKSYYGSYYERDDDYGYKNWGQNYNSNSFKKNESSSSTVPAIYNPNNKLTDQIWFVDKEFDYVSFVEVERQFKRYVRVDIHSERISKEKRMIDLFLLSLDLTFEKTTWDGFNLSVDYNGKGHTSSADRNDLVEFLPQLDYQKLTNDLTEFTDII